VDALILYLGSRFIKESVKLPKYFSTQQSLTLDQLKAKMSNDMYYYITLDLQEFLDSFHPSQSQTLSPKFNKITQNIWIFVVPYHTSFSDLKMSAMISWSIVPVKEDPILINPCDQTTHGDHSFMASFHLNNEELLTYYEKINRGMMKRKRQLLDQIMSI